MTLLYHQCTECGGTHRLNDERTQTRLQERVEQLERDGRELRVRVERKEAKLQRAAVLVARLRGLLDGEQRRNRMLQTEERRRTEVVTLGVILGCDDLAELKAWAANRRAYLEGGGATR